MTRSATAHVVHLSDSVPPAPCHRPVIRTLVAVAQEDGEAIVDALGDIARYQVVGLVDTPDAAQQEVARLRPDVLLLDAMLEDEPMVPWVRTMLASSPSTCVVLCADDMRTALRDEAAAAGVKAIVGHRDPFERVLKTIDNLVPELAAGHRRDRSDHFEERMHTLLEQDEPTTPISFQWWKQRGVRPWLIAASVAMLPLLAMIAWVVAGLAGFTR